MLHQFRAVLGCWVLVVVMSAACLFGLSAAAAATTLEEEIELGRKLDVEILKQTPLSDNEEALREIEEVGQKIVENVQRSEIEYHFRVIKDDNLNAFAIPGGYVYFTDRIWEVLRRDERIGVLGHEIVHVDRRHAIDAISKAQRRRMWTAVLLVILDANQTASDIASLANSLYELKYSRGDERQADEVGIQLVQQAGYNPAGLLLAMRKIKRFEEERGESPPKIFSSHPPTQDRLDYMAQLLTDMGVPIPSEDVAEVQGPDRIGEVMATGRNEVEFSSSASHAVGDVVWLMGPGWDFHYENHRPVPIARGVVTEVGTTYTAKIWEMPTARKGEIKDGVGVYVPNAPEMPDGDASLVITADGDDAVIQSGAQLAKLDRFVAKDAVWNEEYTELVSGDIGYVVIKDPSSETGYVALGSPDYSYVPVDAGAELFAVNDADKDRWVGPIISIGRRGHTIEVLPNRDLEYDKDYEVCYPPWEHADDYDKRIVGTARLKSVGSKIVLKMNDYKPGWGISAIQNGFDIYEKNVEPETESTQ